MKAIKRKSLQLSKEAFNLYSAICLICATLVLMVNAITIKITHTTTDEATTSNSDIATSSENYLTVTEMDEAIPLGPVSTAIEAKQYETANLLSDTAEKTEEKIIETFVVVSTNYVVPVFEEADVESAEIGYLESGDVIVGEDIGDFIKSTDTDDEFYVSEEFLEKLQSTYKTSVYHEAQDETPVPIFTNYTPIISKSGFTIEDIGFILEGTKLEGYEYLFYNTEKKYGINAELMLAICAGESGLGKSDAALYKNNLFGIMPTGTIKAFESKDSCCDYWGKMIVESYINQGRTTLKTLAPRYCGPGYDTWILEMIDYNRSQLAKNKAAAEKAAAEAAETDVSDV